MCRSDCTKIMTAVFGKPTLFVRPRHTYLCLSQVIHMQGNGETFYCSPECKYKVLCENRQTAEGRPKKCPYVGPPATKFIEKNAHFVSILRYNKFET
jgi:NAD-dependent SIR2 family protein deacetylase